MGCKKLGKVNYLLFFKKQAQPVYTLIERAHQSLKLLHASQNKSLFSLLVILPNLKHLFWNFPCRPNFWKISIPIDKFLPRTRLDWKIRWLIQGHNGKLEELSLHLRNYSIMSQSKGSPSLPTHTHTHTQKIYVCFIIQCGLLKNCVSVEKHLPQLLLSTVLSLSHTLICTHTFNGTVT